MIKEVADHLLNIRNVLARTRTGDTNKTNAYFTSQHNVVAIQSAVEMTFAIENAQAEFMAELENYTGGKVISATVFRSAEADQHAYDEVIHTLARYRDTLRNAAVNEEMDIIRGVDTRQVSDPF